MDAKQAREQAEQSKKDIEEKLVLDFQKYASERIHKASILGKTRCTLTCESIIIHEAEKYLLDKGYTLLIKQSNEYDAWFDVCW